MLPKVYLMELDAMTAEQVAAKAAKFRSDCRKPGTATRLTLAYGVRRFGGGTSEGKDAFRLLYREAWLAEKAARLRGQSSRPANRPVIGGRTRKSHKTSVFA